MINLLYHATIYYEIRKYIQESEPNTLKYEMVITWAQSILHVTYISFSVFIKVK